MIGGTVGLGLSCPISYIKKNPLVKRIKIINQKHFV